MLGKREEGVEMASVDATVELSTTKYKTTRTHKNETFILLTFAFVWSLRTTLL